jgi:hypothetical protein
LIVVVVVVQLGLGGVMVNQNSRIADQQDCSRVYAVAEYAAEHKRTEQAGQDPGQQRGGAGRIKVLPHQPNNDDRRQ